MGIKGSVLHDNVFGNTDTERGEIPYGLDTALYHGIRYLLGYFDRYRQHTYIDIVLLHLLLELIRMIDGNATQRCTHHFGLHIEGSHNLQAKMTQTRITQQGTSQASYTEKEGFMYIGKS